MNARKCLELRFEAQTLTEGYEAAEVIDSALTRQVFISQHAPAVTTKDIVADIEVFEK